MICLLTGLSCYILFLFIGWTICRAAKMGDESIAKSVTRDRFYFDVWKRAKEN